MKKNSVYNVIAWFLAIYAYERIKIQDFAYSDSNSLARSFDFPREAVFTTSRGSSFLAFGVWWCSQCRDCIFMHLAAEYHGYPCHSFHFISIYSKNTCTHTLTLTAMKNKKEHWKYIIQLAVAFLTAIGTSLGVTSCMSMICSSTLWK